MINHQTHFKMVHSSPNNAKSRVHQSLVCFLCTTHLGILKHDFIEPYCMLRSEVHTSSFNYTGMFNTICIPYIFRQIIFWWNYGHDTPLCDTPGDMFILHIISLSLFWLRGNCTQSKIKHILCAFSKVWTLFVGKYQKFSKSIAETYFLQLCYILTVFMRQLTLCKLGKHRKAIFQETSNWHKKYCRSSIFKFLIQTIISMLWSMTQELLGLLTDILIPFFEYRKQCNVGCFHHIFKKKCW